MAKEVWRTSLYWDVTLRIANTRLHEVSSSHMISHSILLNSKKGTEKQLICKAIMNTEKYDSELVKRASCWLPLLLSARRSSEVLCCVFHIIIAMRPNLVFLWPHSFLVLIWFKNCLATNLTRAYVGQQIAGRRRNIESTKLNVIQYSPSIVKSIGNFQPKEMRSAELWRHVWELGIRKHFRSKRGGLRLRARPEWCVDFNYDNGGNTVDSEPVVQFQPRSTVHQRLNTVFP